MHGAGHLEDERGTSQPLAQLAFLDPAEQRPGGVVDAAEVARQAHEISSFVRRGISLCRGLEADPVKHRIEGNERGLFEVTGLGVID